MKKFLLLWVLGAFLIAALASRGNLVHFYRLAHWGVSTRGVVTALEPSNHQAVHYSYEVHDSSYSGIGSGGFENPAFGFLSVGQAVFVYYLPNEPSVSCMGHPDQLLTNEEIPIILAALIFPPLALFAWRYRYPSFRAWLTR
jgi:Protein of unknown function (DUF3592)